MYMTTLAIVGTFRQHAPQFLRYCTVGVVNTVLDFTIYTTLTRGWTFWRSHYLLANACSFVLVVTWSFFWNKYWAFRERSASHGIQYIKFVTVTLGGIIIAQSVLFLGVHVFRLYDLIAKLVAGPLVVIWNFLMYRYWAFRTPSAGLDPVRSPVPVSTQSIGERRRPA
jgi:putative flippase GtrA